MQAERVLTADVSFDDEWTIDGADFEDEIRDAIETVRDDHNEQVFVDANSLYQLRVRWNGTTEEVRFDVFAASGTYIIEEDNA